MDLGPLFNNIAEKELVTPPQPPADEAIDFGEIDFLAPDVLTESKAEAPAEPKTPLREWLKKFGLENLLCEMVLRAKTIEANRLHAAGSDAELEYLLGVYEGDELALRVQLVNLAKYIKVPLLGAYTDETSVK